jgi:hypothetical protein
MNNIIFLKNRGSTTIAGTKGGTAVNVVFVVIIRTLRNISLIQRILLTLINTGQCREEHDVKG